MIDENDTQKPSREADNHAPACSDVWEYSEYRATLRLNGKFFALITPDGHNAISKDDTAKLLTYLNRPNAKRK